MLLRRSGEGKTNGYAKKPKQTYQRKERPYDEDDMQDAVSLLAKIKSQADLTTPMELQDAEEALTLRAGTTIPGSQQSSQSSGPAEALSRPNSVKFLQNYPNPFNPSTVLRYEIPRAGRVKVIVYDILGRVVETLVNENEAPGSHSMEFNGERLASGVYLYRLTAPGITQVKKMLLVK